MKNFALITAMLLSLTSLTYAQRSAYNRIMPALQNQLDTRKGADEQFRIIIGMAEKFDQAKLSKQVETMKSEQRREFVINELSCFSAATQADLLKTLNEGQKANIVKDVKSFWIFNGVSCITTREMIYVLSERPDIAYIESDEMRNMLPEASLEMKKQSFKVENPQPVQTNRDGATSIAWNVSQVHADQVWTYNGTTGYDGSGVVVAVIDTGLDYYHPDIFNHIWQPSTTTFNVTHSGNQNATTYTLGTFTYNNTEYILPGWDFVNNDNDPLDDNGHGSHCAGTVAGYGTSGIQTGMAPGATIMALKVLSGAGSGSSEGIMKAMEFAVVAGADVVSMSLGGHTNGLGTLLGADDSYRTAFESMNTLGVVAMVAAGNEGEIYNEYHEQASGLLGIAGTHYAVPDNVGNPGNCPSPWANPEQPNQGGRSAVVTIGASNRNDRKATFSSFGPCTWKRTISTSIYSDYEYDKNDASKPGLIKPDVLVPGTDITSLLYSYHRPIGIEGDTTGTALGHINETVPYVAECGTSMATPGAAGITALVIQAYKEKHGEKPTPAQIDELLEITALPVDFRDLKNNTTGAGRADAKAAIDAIFTAATQPTNFSVTEVNGGCVHLSWTASTAPKGYAIYRNNEQVGTTMATTYTDKNPGAGKHTYYVRAIDGANIQSVRSKAAFCTVQPYAFADNANIIWNDETKTATLGWTPTLSNSSATDKDKLCYIEALTGTSTAFQGANVGSTVYWGICFNPEDLRLYQGMSIDKVTLVVHNTNLLNVDYPELNIYRGTLYGNTTVAPVYHERFTINELQSGWNVITLNLSTPYALTDITEDLWITCSEVINNSNEYPVGVGPYNGHNSNVLYIGTTKQTINPENDLVWSHLPDFGDAYNYSISLEAHLTRTTTYTDSYTLTNPDNTSSTITEISGNYSTQQAPTLASGENTYEVTAKVSTGGNVVNTSCPEDLKIVKVDYTETHDVDIDQTKVYLVQSNGVINSDGITCTDPTRLIVEEGGQVKGSSTPTGTMKKHIDHYTTNLDKYYLLTTPVDGIDPSNVGMITTNSNYELYYFDQTMDHEAGETHPTEWRNYAVAANNFTTLEAAKGYLYANATDTELRFVGPLNDITNNTINLVYDPDHEFTGWNLIGNPYASQKKISQPYYKLNADGSAVNPELETAALAPMDGVFVVATNNIRTVTFSDPTSAVPTPNNVIAMNLTKDRGTVIDKAFVRFDEGSTLPKFTLSDKVSMLYIPQGGKDYAVVQSAEQSEVPVCFKAIEKGTYTLSFNAAELDMKYLHLIDNLTGNDVDLLAVPSYTFKAKANDYAARFRLVWDENAESPMDEEDEMFAYYANDEIRLVEPCQGASLQIIDMTGRVIRCLDVARNVSTSGMTAGVYVLRLINGDNVKTQKILIH